MAATKKRQDNRIYGIAIANDHEKKREANERKEAEPPKHGIARQEPGNEEEDLECGDLSPLSFSRQVGSEESVREPAQFEIQSDDKSSQSK